MSLATYLPSTGGRPAPDVVVDREAERGSRGPIGIPIGLPPVPAKIEPA